MRDVKRYPGPEEVTIEAVRSRGPGGQNVNRTNSAAILRWNLPDSTLPEPVKAKLLSKLANKLTTEGDLLIRSETSRDLEQNRKTCWDKLYQIIDEALFVPKFRVKTKPKKSAVRKRIEGKKKQGEKKKNRSTRWD